MNSDAEDGLGSSQVLMPSVNNVHFLMPMAVHKFKKLSDSSVRRRLFVPLQTLLPDEKLADLVEASGLGTKQAVAGQQADLELDLTSVATALADVRNPLALTIGFAAPPGSDALFDALNMQQQRNASDGSLAYKVSYQVSKPGKYALLVKYGEHHINGSPFEIEVLPASASADAAQIQ